MTRRGAGKRVDATSLIKSFDAHARSYDRMVGANRGYHEHLRFSARRMGIPGGGAGLRLLDIGCGTGASTAALLDAAPEAEIVAVDASGAMLAEARRKTWTGKVTFVQGNVEALHRRGHRHVHVRLEPPTADPEVQALLAGLVARFAADGVRVVVD